MDNLDWNLLKVFLEVYRLKSITLAAESLTMTQPGVSGALKRMQAQLGCELFVREGRGIAPTHTAVQLATELEPAYQRIDNAVANIAGFDITLPRTFVVLVNEAMMHYLQPKVEQDTKMAKVNIEFHLSPNTEDELEDKLNMQKADLAIDITPYANHSYNSISFFEEEIVAICSKNHPDISNSLSKDQYFSQKHITLRLRRAQQHAAEYFTAEALAPRNISCECDSLLSMMALVSNSQCIGIVTQSMAQAFATQFKLNVLALPFASRSVEHKMVWHRRNNKHPAQVWLRDKLRSYSN